MKDLVPSFRCHTEANILKSRVPVVHTRYIEYIRTYVTVSTRSGVDEKFALTTMEPVTVVSR